MARTEVGNDTAVGVVPAATIRTIDWMNRTYASGDATYPVVAGQYEYARDEEGNVVASDYQARDPDAYIERGFFQVTPPVFGDVDGDGAEDAVIVTLENMGGTGMFSSVEIYVLRDGQPVVLGAIPGGDRGDGGIADALLDGKTVTVDRYLSLDGDGACCPSQLQHERWTWDGTAFVEDVRARTVTDNPDR